MKPLFLVLFILLTACDSQPRDTSKLPWKTAVTATGATEVFGIPIGDVTLQALSIGLHKAAEVSLFETPKGALNLEAYFGKVGVGGILEGRIVADLEASDVFLQTEKKQAKDRDATPNNNWKYEISHAAGNKALQMKVWRMVYMPTGQYEEKQIKFFGKPEETISVTKTAQYRLFPQKGIALLWDTEGGEIFYYVAPKDFPRLKAILPMKIVQPTQKASPLHDDKKPNE
ncbi:MAG: hypothetical protein KAG28_00500 [Cocleimonas sp.]|nr:hypothetical protein [Cocleimonas sp.]